MNVRIKSGLFVSNCILCILWQEESEGSCHNIKSWNLHNYIRNHLYTASLGNLRKELITCLKLKFSPSNIFKTRNLCPKSLSLISERFKPSELLVLELRFVAILFSSLIDAKYLYSEL